MNTEFDNNKRPKPNTGPENRIGPLLFLGAMILYLATLSRGPYPGISAKLIADHTGVSPFMPLLHPLWWCFAQVVKAIPIGTIAIRMNIFSAVCGATATWFVYEIVSRIQHDRTTEENHAKFNKNAIQIASGLFAAAFFATAIPIWIVSTRAHTASFDILIILFLVRQLQKFAKDAAKWRFYVIAIGIGLGIMEFPTMLLLAFPFLIALFYQMWINEYFVKKRKGQRSAFWPRLVKVVILIGIGALPLLLVAWIFTTTPAYEWRDFPNFYQLLVHIARQYFEELGGSTSQIGWLLVSLVSFIPCIAVMIRKKEHGRDKIRGSYFFHFVLAAIGIVIIFNIYVSPWALYGSNLILVTPYLFMAVWIGYTAGYWFALFTQRQWGHDQGRIGRTLQMTVKWILIPGYPLLIIAAIAMNLPICNGANAKPVQTLARDVVANMEGRKWLISNGVLDDLITLSAEAQGKEISVINPRLGASKPYLRYLSTRFANPRLKGLALLGLSPLIQEWFTDHREYVEDNVAILSNPDIWLASNYRIVPNGTLYLGSAATNSALRLPDLESNREVWEQHIFTDDERDWPKVIEGWNTLATRHVSKVANNFGFTLQEEGQTDQALQAYEIAHTISPKNISALLNIVSVADKKESADAEEWHRKLDERVENLGRKLNSWNLSYQYGYVYQPMTYVNRGLVWAMSGKPNLGISEIKRAIALGGHGEHLKVLLAGMYFMQEQANKSEEIYTEILKDNPDSVEAIRGLMRIHVRRGNFDIARGYLRRLEESGYDHAKVKIEEAILESVAGNKDRAKEVLKDLLDEDSGNLKAWTMLALIAVEQNDVDLQEKCLKQFRKEDREIPRELLMAMTQVALTQRETATARRHIEKLLERYPRNEEFLEWRLRIDVYEFNREEAVKSVERLMAVNPKNGFANFILGTLHIYREQYALAAPPLRVSVEQKRDVKRLNTLAYTLYILGNYEQATTLAEEALKVDDRHGPAWDTYAMLLYQRGDYDEAMKAIQRALDFMGDNPEVRFHLAQVYEKQGEYQKAKDILEELLLHPSQLPMTVYEEVRETANRVREKVQ